MDGGEFTDELAGDSNAVHVMNEIHALYTKGRESICTLAHNVGVKIHAPRRKVNVLIVGNHSAGKSSFINWYIEDNMQRTGVAIETQGFTIVTSGSKRTLAPIKGDSTVMLYPYLEPLKKQFGKRLVENLNTCVSTSTKRDFPMVDFIDSPGLVDGDILYPFDVNEAVVEFANHVDLVFVFMDPMGQALCSRTMQVVRMLNQKHFDKISYYLTKADTVENSKELMKLMVQITQNIKDRIHHQHGLEVPAIWLPEVRSARGSPRKADSGALGEEVNQIGEVCQTIEKAIHQKVQDNLAQVEADCEVVLAKTKQLLAKDELEIAARKARQLVAMFFAACAWTIPLVAFLILVMEYEHLLPEAVLQADVVMDFVHSLSGTIRPLLFSSPEKLGVITSIKFVGLSLLLFLLLNGISKFTHARANKFVPQKRVLISTWKRHESIIREILERRQQLFLDYVRTYTSVENVAHH